MVIPLDMYSEGVAEEVGRAAVKVKEGTAESKESGVTSENEVGVSWSDTDNERVGREGALGGEVLGL